MDILVYVQSLPIKKKGELVTAALRPAPRRTDPHVKDVQWNMYSIKLGKCKNVSDSYIGRAKFMKHFKQKTRKRSSCMTKMGW